MNSNRIKTYSYDRSTREYTGVSYADYDPITTTKVLVPRDSTLIEPIAVREGYTAIFNGIEWVGELDNRGVKYWDSEGVMHIITDIGIEVPEGFSTLEPEVAEAEDLSEAYDSKKYLYSTDYIDNVYLREVLREKTMTEDEYNTKYSEVMALRRAAIKTLNDIYG